MKTMLIAAGLMSAALAPCAAAQIIPFSQRAPLAWTLSFPRTSLSGWLHSLPAYRIWGARNMMVQHEGSTNVLEVTYPKCSIDPAATAAPVGGAGFIYSSAVPFLSGCLAHDVVFETGFDFPKGGKLLRLYAADSRLGKAATTQSFYN